MRRVARGFLITISIINGIMGLVCAVLLLLAPDGRNLGMQVLLPTIATFPLADTFFRDFVWIGIAMLLGLGIPNLLAAVMLLRRSGMQYVVTLVAGVLLILWCAFELLYMFNVAAVGFLVVGVLAVVASVVLRASARGGHN